VLNIHCSVGSALRITGCHLLRADNNRHHCCSRSENYEPSSSADDGPEQNEQRPDVLDPHADTSHHQHLQPPGSSSGSQGELQTAASPDFLHVDHAHDSYAENSKVCHGHHGSDCSSELHTSAGDVGRPLPWSSLLGPVGVGATSTSHQHPHHGGQHHHLHPPGSCSGSQGELQTVASPDFLHVDHAHDSHAENCKVCRGHRGSVTHSNCSSELQTSAGRPLRRSSLLGPVYVEPSSNIQNHPHCEGLGGVDGMNEVDSSQVPHPRVCTKIRWFHVDRVTVGQLNDVVWVDSCLAALCRLIHIHDPQPLQLIISSQTPLLFPIAALRLGLVSDVCFFDLDPVHRPLIGRLLAANDVSEDRVTFGRPRQRDVTSVLFADIVSSEGCLRQNVFELLNTARCVLFAFALNDCVCVDDDDDDDIKFHWVFLSSTCSACFVTAGWLSGRQTDFGNGFDGLLFFGTQELTLLVPFA